MFSTTAAPARIFGDPSAEKMEMPVINRWFADHGDQTLRLDYPLTSNSIVLDIGGYEGNWAAQIADRYGCYVHVFEPVPAFADNIQNRFASRGNIFLHRFGISDRTARATIFLNNDGTSVHQAKGTPCDIELQSAVDAFQHLGLPATIDLVKINIEGCEYELLQHLIDSGLISRLRDVQVQFHHFVPDAATRMRRLQEQLAATHLLVWQYRFVWENWRRRDVAP